MIKTTKPGKPGEIPLHGKLPELSPEVVDPGEPIVTKEELDVIPDEEMDETPPYEPPPPAEGP